MLNTEGRRPTMRGLKIANAETGGPLEQVMRQLHDLEKRRSKVPRRVPVAQAIEDAAVKLSVERKHLRTS